MNGFFCSIGEDLASNIEGGHDPLIFCDYFLNNNAAKFAFKSIHAEQIRETTGKLKTSNSFGDDGISSYFLKLAVLCIEDSLIYLFNTSLEASQFPDPWKVARVSLIFNQLYRYLNDNCFINSNQSGFRELHFTVTCKLKSTDDWYNRKDTGNLAGMVFRFEKKYLILLIIKFSVGSWNLMAFCMGNRPVLDPIYQTESSIAEQMMSIRILKN